MLQAVMLCSPAEVTLEPHVSVSQPPSLSLSCPSFCPSLSLSCPSFWPSLSLNCPSFCPSPSLSCPSFCPSLFVGRPAFQALPFLSVALPSAPPLSCRQPSQDLLAKALCDTPTHGGYSHMTILVGSVVCSGRLDRLCLHVPDTSPRLQTHCLHTARL